MGLELLLLFVVGAAVFGGAKAKPTPKVDGLVAVPYYPPDQQDEPPKPTGQQTPGPTRDNYPDGHPQPFDATFPATVYHARKVVVRLRQPQHNGTVVVDVVLRVRRWDLDSEANGGTPPPKDRWPLTCKAFSIVRRVNLDLAGHLVVAADGEQAQLDAACDAAASPETLSWNPRLIADGPWLALQLQVPANSRGDDADSYLTTFRVYGEATTLADDAPNAGGWSPTDA